MNKIIKEKAAILKDELIQYEKVTNLTKEERIALHEWVAGGNSVHENGSMAFTEAGIPCDFIDGYRYEEEIRQNLQKLTPKEQENYLARLRGEDTIDNLREDLSKLLFKKNIYEQVLKEHGLLQETERLFQTAMERSKALSDWIKAQPVEELPFQ